MASIQFNITEFANAKPKELLRINSSEVSRISSPIKNYIEIPKSKELELSFISTQSQIALNLPSEEVTEELIGQTKVLEALDEIRNRLKVINEKLDYNLAVFREEEEMRQGAKGVFQEIRQDSKCIFNEEIRCSCTQQCEIF